MISREEDLSIQRQCALVGVARSSWYYQPAAVSEEELAVLRVIDEVHTNRPFVGSRRMVDELSEAGHHLNRKAVRRLMRTAGIEAVYRRPRTTRSASGLQHRVFPYLLAGLAITRANQVWASDVERHEAP